jgi:MOSC domain-containing protein YiiM
MLSFGMEGVVERIFVADYSGNPMQELANVEAIMGCGLRGDRYVIQTGFWSGVDECQVTLIEGEILANIAEDTGLPILAGEHRRNIVTRGIRLQQLLGKRFAVGEALFEFERSRPPCAHIQVLTPPGTAKALFGQRGGIGARVLKSGWICAGDPIRVVTE